MIRENSRGSPMVSNLQPLCTENLIEIESKSEFETSLQTLPSTWYERVHSWGGMEEKRLKGAIELVLQAGINSSFQLLQLLQDKRIEPQVRLAGFLVTGHLRPQD